MTYATLQTSKIRDELAAKTLRYSGYNAKCIRIEGGEQPYQVNVSGITSTEAKELQLSICSLLKDSTINIVECK